MDKIHEDFNFKNHGKYDVDLIKSHILSFNDEWFLDTSRQDNFNPHKDTNSYFIYKSDLSWNKNKRDPFTCKLISSDKTLVSLVEPIIKDLEEKHDGVRANVILIKLKAKTEIEPHSDGGFYLSSSRRHHIAIITHPDVCFSVEEEEINMNPGECWEINNRRTHSVKNNSNIDRVNLLIDIMPNNKIGK